MPGFLHQEPTSFKFKGDESKDLGATLNVFEEFLWLLVAEAPETYDANRSVEVFRIEAADCSGQAAASIPSRTQADVSAIPAATVAVIRGQASGCTSPSSKVTTLIYEAVSGAIGLGTGGSGGTLAGQ